MQDIENRSDIESIVNDFYKEAMVDEHISHFFTEVMPINLEDHIPTICDFWESSLLGARNYKGNPMLKHLQLNLKSPLMASHFDRWLTIWTNSIQKKHDGPLAELMIQRAQNIAEMMKFKISIS